MRSSGKYPASSPVSWNLTRKFLTMFVLGAAVTTVCTALFGYYHAQKLRRDRAAAKMQRVAENLSEQIDMSLDAITQSLILLAGSGEIREAIVEQNKKYEPFLPSEAPHVALQGFELWKTSKNPQAMLTRLESNSVGRTLAEFASRYSGFQVMKAIDREGIVVGAFGKLDSPYVGQEEWWHQGNIIGLEKTVIHEPSFVENRSPAIVQVCTPVLSEESRDFQGTLYAEYNLGRIISRLATDRREIVAFLMTDGSERHLYVLSPPDLASSRSVDFRETGEAILPQSSGHSFVTLNQPGIKAIAGFAPVKHSVTSVPETYQGKKWNIVTAISESHALAPMNSLFLQALGFSVGMLILVSLVGLTFARRLLGPIRILQEGVQEIGQGNLEHRIDVRSRDEIEMLAVEFNRMAERMQRTQEQLQRRTKELEQRVNQLRRLQAQLMQSERMAATGELAAQIAHEINNPLGIIKNYVGIAKMLMSEEDPNRENMKILDQEINRIAGIVRRLLKFAKPGLEDIQSVQINQILEELLALLRGQLFRRKIEILAEFADNLPEVSVSTDQMRQVFLNLIKNAEDAMPDGGKLSIQTRYRKGRVEIEIADNGCGIPQDDIKNIFEPFFTTKGVKGTGLGLSVSYGIIKNYNGEISVDSEPGRGTAFTIQLPVVSDKVFQVIQSS